MNYRTETLEQILKSPEARKIIDYLSPIYGEAYAVLWILQAVGVILDESDSFPETFLLQVTPHTATWSLSFWEKEYNIVPSPSWGIEQRQKNVMATINYRAPLNPKKIENMVSSIINLPVEMIENTGKNKFTVKIRGYMTDSKKATNEIDRAKQAHLIYNMVMAKLIVCPLIQYSGIFASQHKTYELEVIDS